MPAQQINQPSNQIKLTNVSLVRIKKGKKRYEIACYKNKVLEWRTGVETDLDNVLQIPNVFTNVSKGAVAPKEDLSKSFGPKTSLDDIILEILNKGELQVGEKERAAELERVHNEVVDIVAGKLVDPRTKRVYTPGIIKKALDQLSAQSGHASSEKKGTGAGGNGEHKDGGAGSTGSGATTTAAAGEAAAGGTAHGEDREKRKPAWSGVVTTKSAKSQALEAMKALIAHQIVPVARARMRLRVTCATSVLKQAVKAAPAPSSKSSGAAVAAADNGDGDGTKAATGTVKDRILSFVEQVESQDVDGDEWEVVGFVEPGDYKLLSDFVATQTKGRARAEVLDMAVVHED